MTVSSRRRSFRAVITFSVAAVAAIGVLSMGISTLVLLNYVVPHVPVGQALVTIGDPGTIQADEPTLFIAFDRIIPVVMDTLVFSLVLVIAGTSLSAWLLSGRIVRPLATIGDVARRATAGDLGARVRLQGPDDEVRRVAVAIDTMLDDLERSIAAHQRFAANASHELTTPLAIAQALIDVELARTDAIDPETERALVALRAVNRRSIETVEALLDLAEAGQARPHRVPVDLGVVAREIVRNLEPVAAEADVTVELAAAPHLVASGDRVLLRQAIENLVANAIRHNVPGGHVTLAAEAHGDAVTVTVENTGAIVDAAVVETWREPFVRTAARVSGPGRGLGLALIDAIAKSHHGSLDLTPRAGGGLVARLVLPGYAGDPAGGSADG